MYYDASTKSLWITESRDKALKRLGVAGNQKSYEITIDLPKNTFVIDMCVSNDVLVITSSKQIVRLNYADSTWEILNLPSEGAKPYRCKVLSSDNTAFFLEDNSIALYTKRAFHVFSVNAERINDIVQDAGGNLWLLSLEIDGSGSNIIRQGKNDEWVSYVEMPVNSIFFTNPDTLWLESLSPRGLYQWSSPKDTSGPQLISEISLTYFVTNIYRTDNETVWIITTADGIWKAQSASYRKVSLPRGVKVISSSTIDLENCILYISTNRGIYSMPVCDY